MILRKAFLGRPSFRLTAGANAFAPRQLGLAAVVALTLSGCGGTSDIIPVQGKVVWKGGGNATELEGYLVTFQNSELGKSGDGPIQKDGTFQISTAANNDGAPRGKNAVTITPPIPTNPDAPPQKSLIPNKYSSFDTSGLSAEVSAGQREVTLEVEKGAK